VKQAGLPVTELIAHEETDPGACGHRMPHCVRGLAFFGEGEFFFLREFEGRGFGEKREVRAPKEKEKGKEKEKEKEEEEKEKEKEEEEDKEKDQEGEQKKEKEEETKKEKEKKNNTVL